jgi:hypothetical protein
VSNSALVPYEEVVRLYRERTGEKISTASARDAVIKALWKLRAALALTTSRGT